MIDVTAAKFTAVAGDGQPLPCTRSAFAETPRGLPRLALPARHVAMPRFGAPRPAGVFPRPLV
ncbi:hypothetical protein [Mesobacterium pallidum]|uniref:hypothetical protein n=1 Tax=Mesobacterium pallidum TaxID=2872037 RepID=UPI001EE2DBB1|nr:hypothetical protein [Mesobacterium pallidum]